MIIVTSEKVEGKDIKESLGIVKGEIVQSKNFGRDFMAGMKTIVGGEIKGYSQMIEKAKQEFQIDSPRSGLSLRGELCN